MKKERGKFIVFFLLFLFFPICATWASGSYYLSPTSGDYSLDSNITVNLVAGTGGEAVVAGDGSIFYTADTLELISISKGATFTFWNQGPSGSGSLITFSGGRPNPGYTGNGLLFSMVFRPKALGTAQVSVVKGRLFLNSDPTKNILTDQGQTSYNIKSSTDTDKEGEENEEKKEDNKQKPVLPNIVSETHPNSDVWYANKNVKLSWDKAEGVTDFSYDLNQIADTVPDTAGDLPETALEKSDLADGVWYFHLRAKNDVDWSETAHYKLQIDTEPPRLSVFDIYKNGNENNETPYLNLKAEDDGSGVDYFTVSMNNWVVGQITPKQAEQFFLPNVRDGSYQITVQVVDKASNAVSDNLILDVAEKMQTVAIQQKNNSWQIYLFILVIVFLLILSGVIFYCLRVLKRLLKKQKKKKSKKK